MPILTKAAVAYRAYEPMIIEEVELDAPGEGDVLVELKAAGLCRTDLGMWEGHSPIGSVFRSCLAMREPESCSMSALA